jgi:hypothetical protein
MKTHEIEDWALRVIQRILSGGDVEDFRIELKREFIDPEKAARRIAGHANSAGGEPILWIIGVDDKNRRLVDVRAELANWWSSVQSRFDGIAPRLIDVAMSVEGKNVIALFFETDRRPFVVKTAPGRPELEVPWRDGTRVRSASRDELVRLLVPVAQLPNFEVLAARLGIQEIQSSAPPVFELKLRLTVYVTPKNDVRLVFPFHRTSCICELNESSVSFGQIALHEIVSPQSGGFRIGDPHATIRSSATELIVTGPGSFEFLAAYATGSRDLAAAMSKRDRVKIKATIRPVSTNVSAVLKIPLRQVDGTGKDLVAFRYP